MPLPRKSLWDDGDSREPSHDLLVQCWTLMMNPDVIHSLAAEAASAVEPIKAKMAGSVPVERSSQRATNEVEPNKQKKSKQLCFRRC